MPANKRFIILIVVAGLCLVAAGVLAVGVAFFMFRGPAPSPGMRIYKIDQVDSAHPGYRRSTMMAGDYLYVNDYEEAALRLVNPEPTTVIALKGNFGYSKVCSIDGQPASAYVAGDDGSEMPAYEVYRHNGQPPFDWRSATFRKMTYSAPSSPNNGLESADPVLLSEVLTLLREGKPVSQPGFPMAEAASMPCIQMAADQLPGILFCPVLRKGPDDTLYIAESLMFDGAAARFTANWIPVSPKLGEWLKSR
jgi:hypothetical protein